MRAKTKVATATTIHPLYILLAALTLLMLLPMAARADGKSQIVTAWTHADLAGKATALDGVHMHLHHALNCLVGASGAGYDGKQMNPCANAGNGAIPDAKDAATKTALEAAAKEAEAGIVETDLAKAQADANGVAAKLKALE
jgi:hypothetical protein